MNTLLGFLLALAGGLMIYYSKRFKDWFGQWSFAEQNLGGTDQGFVMIGFCLIVAGLLAMFGILSFTR